MRVRVGWVLEHIPASLGKRQTRQNNIETNSHAHSLLKSILETPLNITCMFLDGGTRPEYPERTHTYTGRTCKLHTERPQPGFEPFKLCY